MSRLVLALIVLVLVILLIGGYFIWEQTAESALTRLTSLGVAATAAATVILALITFQLISTTQSEAKEERKTRIKPLVQVTRGRIIGSQNPEHPDELLVCVRIRNVGQGPALWVRAGMYEKPRSQSPVNDVRRVLPPSFEQTGGHDLVAGVVSNNTDQSKWVVELQYRSIADEEWLLRVPLLVPQTGNLDEEELLVDDVSMIDDKDMGVFELKRDMRFPATTRGLASCGLHRGTAPYQNWLKRQSGDSVFPNLANAPGETEENSQG